MPVLMVSLKTWPQVGFSKNRSIDPSSRVMTIPNSSGFSTALSAIVASAPFDAWGSRAEAFVELSGGVAARPRRAQRRLFGGVDHPDTELGPVTEVAANG